MNTNDDQQFTTKNQHGQDDSILGIFRSLFTFKESDFK